MAIDINRINRQLQQQKGRQGPVEGNSRGNPRAGHRNRGKGRNRSKGRSWMGTPDNPNAPQPMRVWRPFRKLNNFKWFWRRNKKLFLPGAVLIYIIYVTLMSPSAVTSGAAGEYAQHHHGQLPIAQPAQVQQIAPVDPATVTPSAQPSGRLDITQPAF